MSVNNTKPSRRQFLGTAGLVGAGAVLASCAPATAATPGKANLDAAILNFALNLEYLEAAFYLTAVGRLSELDAAGGNSAMVTLNANAAAKAKDGKGTITDPTLLSIVNEIATDEVNHVKVLRGALKSNAVAQPQLDLGGAFQAAGSAASGGAITGFDPYANDLFFLHGAFIFEDVGVTAYKGAAILVTDDSKGGVLDTAAGILAVEAYHAGYVRTVLFQQRATVAAAGLNVAQITSAISALRGKVGGGKDQGIVSPEGNAAGAANLVPTDDNSVAFSRSTSEVLAIVYLGGMGKGGFFPNGLNGAIK
ncbi:ferritin-like domain-containing protein [Deinococcus radiomollis]|uniref:ferritin-like domain-containing protein n=1 Tax=Deinococcus radiomollis TaxID=468916 RepID=UPI003891CAF3